MTSHIKYKTKEKQPVLDIELWIDIELLQLIYRTRFFFWDHYILGGFRAEGIVGM